MNIAELTYRLRHASGRDSKSALLKLCLASAEALTVTDDQLADTERFIRQTFADEAMIDDTGTGEFIAETRLDDVMPALAAAFAAWKSSFVAEQHGDLNPDRQDLLERFDRWSAQPETGSIVRNERWREFARELRAAISRPDTALPSSAASLERFARALNSAGWTCAGGAHEPGQFDTCAQCCAASLEQAKLTYAAAFGGAKDEVNPAEHEDWCHYGRCSAPCHCTCDLVHS
ncbi:hypothetical protein [Leucobacter sp. cx-169]|uniref:hypothetical protein n=1 Tax=Leucobacter sp. cx-169 TaxID=2770549 RepID=UPI00165D855A|nr:hypothetical protein [Leucobacter sp. cx-169]MBC9927265.1 hypothetical protein [Leucobacter sp. cx-169]